MLNQYCPEEIFFSGTHREHVNDNNSKWSVTCVCILARGPLVWLHNGPQGTGVFPNKHSRHLQFKYISKKNRERMIRGLSFWKLMFYCKDLLGFGIYGLYPHFAHSIMLNIQHQYTNRKTLYYNRLHFVSSANVYYRKSLQIYLVEQKNKKTFLFFWFISEIMIQWIHEFIANQSQKSHGTVLEYCLLVFTMFQLQGQKDGICCGITL